MNTIRRYPTVLNEILALPDLDRIKSSMHSGELGVAQAAFLGLCVRLGLDTAPARSTALATLREMGWEVDRLGKRSAGETMALGNEALHASAAPTYGGVIAGITARHPRTIQVRPGVPGASPFSARAEHGARVSAPRVPREEAVPRWPDEALLLRKAPSNMTATEVHFVEDLRKRPDAIAAFAQKILGKLEEVVLRRTGKSSAQVRGRFTLLGGRTTVLNASIDESSPGRLSGALPSTPLPPGKVRSGGTFNPWATVDGRSFSAIAFGDEQFRGKLALLQSQFLATRQRSRIVGDAVRTGPGEYRLAIEIPNSVPNRPPLDWGVAIRVSRSLLEPHFEIEALGEPRLREGTAGQLPAGTIASYSMSPSEAHDADRLMRDPRFINELAKQVLGDVDEIVARQRADGDFDVHAVFKNPHTKHTERAVLVVPRTGPILIGEV